MESIRQIATDLRVLASEIGGMHHTSKESEELINELAEKLEDISYELTTEAHTLENISGVSRSGYELYRRQKAMEEYNKKHGTEPLECIRRILTDEI